MSTTISSQHLDCERLESLQAIAASIFARHGVEFTTVQLAGGWTNAVWLSADLVLRLSMSKGNDSLLREARLAALFPPEVGYPRLLETGATTGFVWSLARGLPRGGRLGVAWTTLGWEERITALRGLWERAQAVHTVPVAEAAGLAPRRTWFNAVDAGEAQAGLARLTQAGILAVSESRVLQAALDRFWRVVPTAPPVLCHGDLTLDNAVWHAGQVAALLDFEFAVLAPIQLDLNHLVKCAFGPEDAAHPLSQTDFQGRRQLRQAVAVLAQPLLAQPGGRELLVGYAILLELWLVELWLAHPEGEGPLEQWAPLRRLRSLAEDTKSYLAPLTLA